MEQFEGNLEHFNVDRPYTADDRMPVQFYMGVLLDDTKTAEAGRPVYNDVECIKIFNSKDNIIDRPVRDTDRARWARAYREWKMTGESVPGATGTRLEHWPQMSRAQVEELKYFKIFTVEQLAEVPDSTAQHVMGIQRLRTLAKTYVELARQEAPLVKMQEALAERDSQIAALVAQVNELGTRLEEFMNNAPANRVELPVGRPPMPQRAGG